MLNFFQHFLFTQDIIFSVLDTTECGLLNAIERYLSEIIIPFLKRNENGWGQLGSQANLQTREDFFHNLQSFVSILGSAQNSLEERVELKKCETYDLSKLSKPADYVAVANSTQDVEIIEGVMAMWIKQIEQVRYFHT